MKASLLISLLSFSIASPLAFAVNVPTRDMVTPVSLVKTETPVNLNTADAKALSKSIKGIGLKRAQAIVKYREEHGNFKSIDSLSEVPGLGKKFVVSHYDVLQKTFTVE